MSNKKINAILCFISLFLVVHSEDITVKAKGLNSFCEKNLFKVIIDVEFSSVPQNYINFYLNVQFSKNLLFKCIIDPSLSQIICITNLEQQNTKLGVDEMISMPYPFPEVEGITWHYISFLFLIYRRLIKLESECGESVLKKNETISLNDPNWDLIVRVNKAYGGKCLISGNEQDNFYSFSLNLNIIGGNLKENLVNAGKNYQIELMQNITLPISIGELKILGKSNTDEDNENNIYKYAFCYPSETISSENFLKEGGLEFKCNIPIIENSIFNGPVKIKTFSDNIFSSVTNEDKKKYISIYFLIDSKPNTFNGDDENDSSINDQIKKDNNNDSNNEKLKVNVLTDLKKEDNPDLNKEIKENNNTLSNSDLKTNSDSTSDSIQGNTSSSDEGKINAENTETKVANNNTENAESKVANNNIENIESKVANNNTKNIETKITNNNTENTETKVTNIESNQDLSNNKVNEASDLAIENIKVSTDLTNVNAKDSPNPSEKNNDNTDLISMNIINNGNSSDTNTSNKRDLSNSREKYSKDTVFDLPNKKHSSKLRNLQKKSNEKPIEEPYLLIDNRNINYICPDKPVFVIDNVQRGIIYQPIENDNDKISLILNGHLKNGYKISQDKVTLLEYTPEEIKFNLTFSNNLVEDSSVRKSNLLCSLSAGSLFLADDLTKIRCVGNKDNQKDNRDTDLTVNWAFKENKYLNDIVIQWPKDLRVHSKQIYSYNIAALSIKKSDYDCYDNKYYFYVNILSLQYEPQISLEIPMKLPKYIKAFCKLYTYNLLKCYLDLRLYKLSKGSPIQLPDPGNYNISTREGNFINFTVLHFTNENNTELADEGIITDETCGNNVIIGAIRDIGYSYLAALLIVIGISCVFGLIFLCVGFCIIYEIKHRNKKGGYFSHTEEKNKATDDSTKNMSITN